VGSESDKESYYSFASTLSLTLVRTARHKISDELWQNLTCSVKKVRLNFSKSEIVLI